MARASDLEFRIERAKKLGRALRNKRWTRTLLAKKTGYDEKTIRNVLAGEAVRDQTIINISQALDLEAELENTLSDVDVAADEYGGYVRNTHRQYEGLFRVYRRSFTRKSTLFKTLLRIYWSQESDHFKFVEYYKLDEDEKYGAKAHWGPVYMSSYTNLMHLMTIFEGSIRLATLTKMRESERTMRGMIVSQSESLLAFQPTVAPIVISKSKETKFERCTPADIKMMDATDDDYDFARRQIDLTEREIVMLAFEAAPSRAPLEQP